MSWRSKPLIWFQLVKFSLTTVLPITYSRLAKFSDHWSPKIVAEMNDHEFKLAKFQGEFV